MDNFSNLSATLDTAEVTEEEFLGADDAIFIIANSILILTMQSGFGLLECGCVSFRSAANIMFKNSVDIIFGSIAFWAYGWALSFGTPSNPFCSYGQFFFIPSRKHPNPQVGTEYISFFFQSTFASTATTIVSGSIAERANMHAYVIFSSVNMLTYVIPASWVWGSNGFLLKMGFYDFAGGQVVHGNGGFMALYVAWLIGPRLTAVNGPPGMSSPVTALSGTFILWFAWFGFNCGTTFSVRGNRWKLAALIANNTLQGSAGGGMTAIMLSIILQKRNYNISWLINGILGGLVGITSNCSITEPHESLFIGAVGAAVAIGASVIVERFKIDDPVSAFAVHGAAGFWGSIATGLFGHNVLTEELTYEGYLYSNSFYLVGVQVLGVTLIVSWSVIVSAILLWLIAQKFPIRLSEEQEIIGADRAEHNVKPSAVTFIEGQRDDVSIGGSRTMSVMSRPMSHRSIMKPEHEMDFNFPRSQSVIQSMMSSRVSSAGSGPLRRHQTPAPFARPESVMSQSFITRYRNLVQHQSSKSPNSVATSKFKSVILNIVRQQKAVRTWPTNADLEQGHDAEGDSSEDLAMSEEPNLWMKRTSIIPLNPTAEDDTAITDEPSTINDAELVSTDLFVV